MRRKHDLKSSQKNIVEDLMFDLNTDIDNRCVSEFLWIQIGDDNAYDYDDSEQMVSDLFSMSFTNYIGGYIPFVNGGKTSFYKVFFHECDRWHPDTNITPDLIEAFRKVLECSRDIYREKYGY